MIDIKISNKIKSVCKNPVLGCVKADVKVEKSGDELLQKLDKCCEELIEKIAIEDIVSLPRVKDSREVYKALGKAPSKYRVSSEALMRRILQKKGVYKINNIVEINNIISIKSGFSVGSYNLKNIEGPICLTVGEEGQKYKGIGKDLINIENLPVLSDSISTFGSPTSDSERAMITEDTKQIIMCIYSFSGKDEIEDYLNKIQELLKIYANATNIEIAIVE